MYEACNHIGHINNAQLVIRYSLNYRVALFVANMGGNIDFR
jgi:hypothetical protein